MEKGHQDTKKIGTDSFPFAVYRDSVPSGILHFTNWHWHSAIQFCLMEKGHVTI